MSPDGTPRTEGATFWVVDVIFSPFDNQPIVMDWNNHRVVTFDDDDKLRVLSGVEGRLGDGPEGPAALAEWNHPTDVAWLSVGPNELPLAKLTGGRMEPTRPRPSR